MKRINIIVLICSLLGLMALSNSNALAHQPYCEQVDLTVGTPWQVPDATISYAYFGSLYPDTDIDYFAFDAAEGQSVLLSMSIPAYEGAEDYAPVMVVMGPGIEGVLPAEMPESITIAAGHGAMMVPVGDEPVYWFEPYGRQFYYNWDDYFFDAPQNATYTVALWHPRGELGRYSFVVGQEEIRGGDPDCFAKMGEFWTPVTAGQSPYPEVEAVNATVDVVVDAVEVDTVEVDTVVDTATNAATNDGSNSEAASLADDKSQLMAADMVASTIVNLQVTPCH